MAKKKQYSFSARTTKKGLKALNEFKSKLKVSWDEMVVEVVSTQYNLDKAMMTLRNTDRRGSKADNRGMVS